MVEIVSRERVAIPSNNLQYDLTAMGEEEIIEVTTDVLNTYAHGTDRLLIKNPFNKWDELDYLQTVTSAEDFIRTVFYRGRQYDAARTLGSKQLTLRSPLNILTPLYKRFGGRQWRMELTFQELHNLGDGQASFSRDSGWDFSQKNGRYENLAQFVVKKPY